MMIINRVPELVAEKFGGAEKINLQAIHYETKLNYATVRSWVKGTVTRIDFPALDAWCMYLKVQPGDILKYEDEQDTRVK